MTYLMVPNGIAVKGLQSTTEGTKIRLSTSTDQKRSQTYICNLVPRCPNRHSQDTSTTVHLS